VRGRSWERLQRQGGQRPLSPQSRHPAGAMHLSGPAQWPASNS
jgi:hypothetical protein